MSSSNKDRYYSTVGKSRRSSPGDSQDSHGVFFQTGQGGRTVLPPLANSVPTSNRLSAVPASYSNPYTQPRSAATKLGYDLSSQALYGAYQPASASPQFPTGFPNYEMHERYSPQPSYPAYPSRSSTPNIVNPGDRRLAPLTTSTPPPERWQQSAFMPQSTGFANNSIRSPTASYPPAYMAYSAANQPNGYSYHMQAHDHATSMNPQAHGLMYEDPSRLDPRPSSPYNRGSGSSSHVPPPRSYSPPPVSPTSPEEPTIKKKRKRADAAQLKVLNETYNRTAFPSTEERIALAKMLDMSARSVQIWFQNKRQSMRQTNRQSSAAASGSHHPFSMASPVQVDPMVDDLVPHYDTGSGPMNDQLYLAQDPSRSHGSHSHHYLPQSSSHRHSRD